MHLHQTTFSHGDIVYLKTDPAQMQRMVIAFTIRPGGIVYYEVGCGAESSFHFEIEMSSECNDSLRLGLNKEASK